MSSVFDFANMPSNINIKQRIADDVVKSALDGAIEANEANVEAYARSLQMGSAFASTGPIQRRGDTLPGDTGQNFGLNTNFMTSSPYGQYGDFFGSREIGGNYFNSFGFGGVGFGQGSSTGFSRNTMLAHYKMTSAVSAYKGFGIIKNVIDLMANFASEGLTIKHKRKNVEKFYRRWAEHVGLQERVNAILRYYYKYSNVFIYTIMGRIDDTTYDKMKRAKAGVSGPVPGFEKVDRAIGDTNDPEENNRKKNVEIEKQKPLEKRDIPWRYQLLNPFQMELVGSEFFGESNWVFIMDPETSANLKNGKLRSRYSYIDFLDESDVNLPPEFKKLLEKTSDKRVVKLDQSKLWTLFYMKDDHEDWADPMIWPVMNDIYFKNKLRQMDISVANSVINSITIFKLGDWKAGFVPPKEHFRKFSEFLRTPTAAMTMVWNDAVDVITNHPPVDKLLGIQKYESVDRDILRGLGIPDTLVGGASTSNFSTGFLGVRTLLERLEEGRNAVLRWINSQLRIIADTMGHREIPTIKFGKMSLRDEKAEKQLVLGLLDRNVISIEAVLETFGEDFGIELQRMRDEKAIADKEGILVKHGPFTDPMATMTDEEVMDREEEQADKEAQRAAKQRNINTKIKSGTKRQNGRPTGTEGIPQEKKRETKPKGMAQLINYEKCKAAAIHKLNVIEKSIADEILQLRDKRYKKELSVDDRKAIEDITFVIAMHIDSDLSDENIKNCIKNNRVANAEIYNAYLLLVEDGMGLSQRKNAMASAIATFESGINNEK